MNWPGADMINYDRMSTLIPLEMGLHDEADDFLSITRVVGMPDGPAADDYLDNPPMYTYRMTPLAPVAEDPHPFPVYKDREGGLGLHEKTHVDSLEWLKNQAIATYTVDGLTAEAYEMSNERDILGLNCVVNLRGCGGNNQDTTYIGKNFAFRFEGADAVDFVLMVGVLHSEVLPISYASQTMRNISNQLSVASVIDTEMIGSGTQFGTGYGLLLDDLYAWKFARDCFGEPYCTEIRDDEYGVPPEEYFQFTERAYLNEATATGPYHHSLEPSWGIGFRRE